MNNIKTNAGWNFDNSYSRLPKLFYSFENPTPVKEPKIIKLNDSLASTLGLDINLLNTDIGASVFAGNIIPEGAKPIAQAYAGHQFGHFTILGDGRAILLGEHITPEGKRVDIQLKGSGLTPYSRQGDGRAVLGPMLREYIISEAMHALKIPTTRSLAVVTTGERVFREQEDRGAILTRIASSHLRVGTFEYAANFGSQEELKTLADYTIERHFPNLLNEENKYKKFYQEVIKRQAELISKWQLIGFVHGVMNTDNMTISGETIDYGPCAFMDIYDPNTVFSSIDRYGRYAYGNQPRIAAWNLARFGEAILPLLNDDIDQALKIANVEISKFHKIYNQFWLAGMRKKLGIFNHEDQDEDLIKTLLYLMNTNQLDYTNTFISITFNRLSDKKAFKTEGFRDWFNQYQERLTRQNETWDLSFELMKANNPAIIPRNHLVEEALQHAIKDNYTYMDNLLAALKNPYAHTPDQEIYSIIPDQSNCQYQTYCGT